MFDGDLLRRVRKPARNPAIRSRGEEIGKAEVAGGRRRECWRSGQTRCTREPNQGAVCIGFYQTRGLGVNIQIAIINRDPK
jgi:hypothetical protein